MRSLLRTSVILSALLTVGTICFPQTDPKSVPQPPTAELAKFDPFLGEYEVSGDFANLPWAGSVELRKAIKGWYIEQIILVKTEGIDREFRILATWDKGAQKYRLWGFQTLPTALEGDIRFENSEMTTQWITVRPDGTKVLASNRYHFMQEMNRKLFRTCKLEMGRFRELGRLEGREWGAQNR